MITDCQYPITELTATQCVGDTVDSINFNFGTLNTAICDLEVNVAKRLKIQNQYILLDRNNNINDADTFVLHFTGDAVDAFIDPPDVQTTRKTVYIPLTGVYSLSAADTIVDDNPANYFNNVLVPTVEVLSSTGPWPGEGVVTLRLRVPNPPKQIRTFFYSGPSSTTAPTDGMGDGSNNIPTVTTIEKFVNTLDLNNFNSSRVNDEIWVVYQKTGYQTVPTASITVPNHVHDWTISVTVPSHNHTMGVAALAAVVSHVHSMDNTASAGDHSHTVNVICKGYHGVTSSSNGLHQHPGGNTGSNGAHSHGVVANADGSHTSLNDTDRSFTINDTSTAAGGQTVPRPTTEQYMNNTALWKLSYNGNYYKVVLGYPKFVQAQTALSLGDWTNPQNWLTFEQTF